MSQTEDRVSQKTIDFILSLLYASVNSYKQTTLIKPLPAFLNSCDELVNCFAGITYPPLSKESDCDVRPIDQFIDWIETESNCVELVPFDAVLAKDFDIDLNDRKTVPPNFVARVKNPNISEDFRTLSAIHGTAIGFHGTPTANVFSILRNGLFGHLNKRNLFGAGTYLSTDLGIALSFSKLGKSWPLSCLGRNMLCVLVCEVIKSEQVKQGKEKLSGISINTDSIPHNYFVVKNNDHLRVTHVLVYITKCKSPGKRGDWFIEFLKGYGVVLFYGLVLMLICLNSNNSFRRWMFTSLGQG